MEFSYIIIQVVTMLLIIMVSSSAMFLLFKRRSRCSLDNLSVAEGITLRHALELCVLEKVPPAFRSIVKPVINMLCVEDLVKLCKK